MRSLRWTLTQYDRDSIKRGNSDARTDIHRGKTERRDKEKEGKGHVKTVGIGAIRAQAKD